MNNVIRTLLGSRRDWRLDRLRAPRIGAPTLGWLGPIAVAVSTLVGWFAFEGARGEEGSVAFGLFIGSTSIVLMAWSFLLAIRLRMLEPFFGGLDSMYRVHRWTGSLAVLAMYLHTSSDSEIEGAVAGASEGVADAATGLAGTAETFIYLLIAFTLLRWVPYRFWRVTHKLLGIPFAIACWHFFTSQKPYANSDPWGMWFNAVMLVGLVAFVVRVVARDMLAPGKRFRVATAETTATTTELVLEPIRRPLRFRAGQFAFLKLQEPGMSEPHAFTIASHPLDHRLRFFIRDVGDWSRKLREGDWVGHEVIVEGPYGGFAPTERHKAHTLWVAGGVGVTPFLSAIGGLEPRPGGSRPTLVYSVRERATATAISELERAAAEGRIDLFVYDSSAGNRLTPAMFREHLTGDPGSTHVAMCGPSGLVDDMATVARSAGIRDVETEDFEIRKGLGPDLSMEVDELIARVPVEERS